MSNRFFSFRSFLLLFVLIGQACSNKMVFEKKPDFMIEEAYYTLWISGIKGGGSSLDVTLEFSENNPLKQTYLVRGLFFKDSYITLSEKETLVFSGSVKNIVNVVDVESDDRDNNQSELEKKDNPFNSLTLKSNEGILHYTEKDKDKYYKLQLQEKDLSGIPM